MIKVRVSGIGIGTPNLHDSKSSMTHRFILGYFDLTERAMTPPTPPYHFLPSPHNTYPFQPETQMINYQQEFASALEFSEQLGFSADSQDFGADETRLPQLLLELPTLIPEVLKRLSDDGYEPVKEFGAQCANTHLGLLRFIQAHYPEMRPNFTIGEFGIDSRELYSLTRADFERWLKAPPEIVDCHTWITLGSKTIIDCTGPTYIQTRIHLRNCLGGIAHGTSGNLAIAPILVEGCQSYNADLRGVRYIPVAIGAQAFHAAAPRRRETS